MKKNQLMSSGLSNQTCKINTILNDILSPTNRYTKPKIATTHIYKFIIQHMAHGSTTTDIINNILRIDFKHIWSTL